MGGASKSLSPAPKDPPPTLCRAYFMGRASGVHAGSWLALCLRDPECGPVPAGWQGLEWI